MRFDSDMSLLISASIINKSSGIKTVRSAKELLEKCHSDKSDIFLALFHTRNTNKYELPSPAQTLMARHLRSTTPTTEEDTNILYKLICIKQAFSHTETSKISLTHMNYLHLLKH